MDKHITLQKMAMKFADDNIAFYAKQEKDAKLGMALSVLGVVGVVVFLVLSFLNVI